jgi:hypothetical protein
MVIIFLEFSWLVLNISKLDHDHLIYNKHLLIDYKKQLSVYDYLLKKAVSAIPVGSRYETRLSRLLISPS